MSKKKTRNVVPVNSSTVSAYSIYATGAAAAVYIGSDSMLNSKTRIPRKERKQLEKVRDTAATVTAVGAMVTVVSTVKASVSEINRYRIDLDDFDD